MSQPRIPDADLIDRARQELAAQDPALALAHARLPPLGWRVRSPGFHGLLRMIVEQQVSVQAAAAIWARVQAGLGEVTPAAVLALDDAELRALGLSAPKARYSRALAQAHASGALDFDTLRTLGDAEAVAALTAVKGVGRWTAETYLMFAEGRLDLFPAGDVALQESLRVVEGAQLRLSEKALYARAEGWRPWRSVAAHLLWDHWRLLRGLPLGAPVLNGPG